MNDATVIQYITGQEDKKKCKKTIHGITTAILSGDERQLDAIFKNRANTQSLSQIHYFGEFRKYAIAYKQENPQAASRLDYFIKD
jgi:hypothetical protein